MDRCCCGAGKLLGCGAGLVLGSGLGAGDEGCVLGMGAVTGAAAGRLLGSLNIRRGGLLFGAGLLTGLLGRFGAGLLGAGVTGRLLLLSIPRLLSNIRLGAFLSGVLTG